MAIMRVPPMFRPPLQSLRDIPDDVFEAISEALRAAPDYSAPSALVEAVTAATGATDPELDGEGLIQTLVSLRSQTWLEDVADEDAAILALTRDVAASPDVGIEVEDQRAAFAERLARLLDMASIATVASALDVVGEGERIFGSARILTDIRPVFGPEPEQRPRAAIIVNTLKIDCFTAQGTEEFFVVLEADDLDSLKEVVDRAITKTQTVRGLLRDAQITDFRSDGRSDDAALY